MGPDFLRYKKFILRKDLITCTLAGASVYYNQIAALLINLSHHHFDSLIGVCVIWCGKNKTRIIYAGRGNFGSKLIEIKSDKKVQKYGPDLFVTWAGVPFDLLDGVESFLCTELNPEISNTSNPASLISVNLTFLVFYD